jgi:L-threonylcarbamoyladenylate synthase
MNRWLLSEAARAIHGGGVIAYPTEAVFGLGCDPLNPDAVQRLLALKQRPMHKGLILIAADMAQLIPFIAPLSDKDKARLAVTWPGPHTWLLPARADTPRWLRGSHSSIAVRITAHPITAALCRAAGQALVSTSANPAGRPPARNAFQTRRYFPNGLDDILHSAVGTENGPTAIRDLATGRLLRSSGA